MGSIVVPYNDVLSFLVSLLLTAAAVVIVHNIFNAFNSDFLVFQLKGYVWDFDLYGGETWTLGTE